MRREISPLRRLKYQVLQHLPGQRGWHYKRKLRLADDGATDAAFASAIEGAAGKVCVDLGANLGVFSRRMAATAGRVYAFEPDPWTAQELRKAVADLPNVAVIEAAAGVEDGTISLYRSKEFQDDPGRASQSSSIIAEKRNIDSSSGIDVPVVDFVRWLEALDSDVALIKMDIEGAEVALLERLMDAPVLSRVDAIFVETHESRIPELAARTEALRARAARLPHPVINLDWK